MLIEGGVVAELVSVGDLAPLHSRQVLAYFRIVNYIPSPHPRLRASA